ncbi:MAG: orotidine-5'-phosphate decarboxylase [Oscillatoriaceae cyanobacterium Prado104]|jgi:orotidine-5'-phosphate decarboxylase|nr:orotidine-5'-phosphate decarboxylase [Oscillatoriaceae cyanobacterium Prado104]
MNFADKLVEQQTTKNSSIVVGIDPNFDLMPAFLQPDDRHLQSVTNALIDFSKIAIDSVQDLVPAVKFQSAYFEQFGSAGIAALARSIAYAKNQKLLVILDAKRGDIGSTSLAYARSYLAGKTQLKNGLTVDSDLEVDCMTINPFLGEDSLAPFLEVANRYEKGLFILVKTSNPGSQMIQDRIVNGKKISYHLADLVNEWGKDSIGESGYSCIGAVVGATFAEEAKQLRELMPKAIFLVPGVGSQGGKIENISREINDGNHGAIVPISRGITYFSDLGMSLLDYQSAMRTRVQHFIEVLKQDKDSK